jgi:hypothetical protein
MAHLVPAQTSCIRAPERSKATWCLRRSALSWTLALLVGCSSATRGPVDRSVDAVHATNRTIGESVETAVASPAPRNVVRDVVTFPVRLVRRVFSALAE